MDSSVIMPGANKESARKRKPQVKPIVYSNQTLPFNFYTAQILASTKMNQYEDKQGCQAALF